jgi:secondary thiamine-phosphate synthase enzyme
MKSHRHEIWMETPARVAFVNITEQVAAAVRASGVREGLALVNAMHITASVFVNDDEAGLLRDYARWLEELAPHEPLERYAHNLTGEDNGDAHLKRQVMGREVVLAITAGALDLGPWEQVCCAPRRGLPDGLLDSARWPRRSGSGSTAWRARCRRARASRR